MSRCFATDLVDLLLIAEAGLIVAAVVALFPLAWICASFSKVLVALVQRQRHSCPADDLDTMVSDHFSGRSRPTGKMI